MRVNCTEEVPKHLKLAIPPPHLIPPLLWLLSITLNTSSCQTATSAGNTWYRQVIHGTGSPNLHVCIIGGVVASTKLYMSLVTFSDHTFQRGPTLEIESAHFPGCAESAVTF